MQHAVERLCVTCLRRRGGRVDRRCVVYGARLAWCSGRFGGYVSFMFLLFFLDVFGGIMWDLGGRGVCLLHLCAQMWCGLVSFAVALDGSFDAAV